MPNALAGVLRPMVIGRELASVGVSSSPKSGNQNRRSQLPKMTPQRRFSPGARMFRSAVHKPDGCPSNTR